MKSAGKARNNGLYRHIRTSKEIIRNLLNDCVQHYYKNDQKPCNHKDTACILQPKGFFQMNFFFCFLHAAHSRPLKPNLPILS